MKLYRLIIGFVLVIALYAMYPMLAIMFPVLQASQASGFVKAMAFSIPLLAFGLSVLWAFGLEGLIQ
jgi:hypothetical protein